MPVILNEIIIKSTVGKGAKAAPSSNLDQEAMAEIVKRAVEQVLESLAEDKQR